ncbi:sensor histidine kinase [Sphingobacterium lumbrici]|uniref:sensor histidine kinase n=1 Tax=Sphingobacterium lumbrici TaxID=2559600 RepID=UPI0015E3FCD6|nr:ATP-binding protein [Sphingobacterium lumbrici]
MQCVHLNLQDLFSSVVEKYRTAKDNLVKLDLSLRTKQTTIYADLLHFANIIDNLIENAIKYSNERVHIEITVTDAQDKLKITVKDDGLGILDSDLPHIFTTFYRSNDKEIQRRVGLGLGLTYVKALVEAHGGEIKVKSKFGMGSEFIVYFP